MPKDLPHRCRPDSIEEFRASARQRFRDGLALLADGRTTGAIYVWGYAAEMILKAGYFRLIGFAQSQPVTLLDLKTAVTMAKNLGIPWTGNLHYLLGWTELLLTTRIGSPQLNYHDPKFANAVRQRGRSLQRFWNERLRYHKNKAYLFEAEKTCAATEWLLDHDLDL